jgi:hypothetical protein
MGLTHEYVREVVIGDADRKVDSALKTPRYRLTPDHEHSAGKQGKRHQAVIIDERNAIVSDMVSGELSDRHVFPIL